jgi:gas vesicle protein
MKSYKMVIGIVAGLATGLLAGVLFAPEKGVRTRRKILRAGVDLTDDIRDKVENALDAVQEKYDMAIKNAEVKIRTLVAGKPEDGK